MCLYGVHFQGLDKLPLVGTIGSFDRNTFRFVIDNHILPFVYNAHGGPTSLVPQEDNSGPHRDTSISTYLANEEITRIKWQAQSSDMNPTDNYGVSRNRVYKIVPYTLVIDWTCYVCLRIYAILCLIDISVV